MGVVKGICPFFILWWQLATKRSIRLALVHEEGRSLSNVSNVKAKAGVFRQFLYVLPSHGDDTYLTCFQVGPSMYQQRRVQCESCEGTGEKIRDKDR